MHTPPFLISAFVFLLAAAIAVPIFKRLGLGSVLGYLVAGLVIGPSVLNLAGSPDTIIHFAEFGVVLLLFLVGLELNLQRLWQMRASIFGLGLLQVVLTIGLLALISLGFKAPWQMALVLGMGFAMSSTAIALQSLQERNLNSTEGGRASFAVLLFQDISVIPILLALALMSGQSDQASAVPVWAAVLIIAAVAVVARYALRPFLRWIALTGMREVFIAAALLIAVGSAVLASSLGLSMALGTFLAGVLLADTEYRHELEIDIEPFKGLLLGLFFIAIGMSIDLKLLVTQPGLILQIAVISVLAKSTLLYFLGWVFKLNKQDRWLFVLAMLPVGEFAFVIFSNAVKLGLLPEQRAAILNAAVTVTLLMSPLAMLAYDRLICKADKGGKDREADAIEERNDVVIAGFGRVGQVVARMLLAAGHRITIIEHDPNQIELVKRFGWKAYFGDATRLDVLEGASIGQANLLVLAFDDPEALIKTAKLIREKYPNLKIVARARSRSEAFELHAMNIPYERETFRSAVYLGEQAVIALGMEPHHASSAASAFIRHDLAMIERQAPHRADSEKLRIAAAQSRQDLETLLREEFARIQHGKDGEHTAEQPRHNTSQHSPIL